MDVLSVVVLPLWSIPAAVIVLCFLPDVVRVVRRRVEARRLRAVEYRRVTVYARSGRKDAA